MQTIRKLIFDEWNLHHIARHNIERDEVVEACFPTRLLRRGKGNSQLVYGQTDAGRFIIVVVAPRGQGAYYVITARDMVQSERRRYRAHTRK
jgi:hypothetical protein